MKLANKFSFMLVDLSVVIMNSSGGNIGTEFSTAPCG